MFVQITDKCLPSILKLQHLEDLVLEGCFGIDDDSLAALKHGCKSLKVSNCCKADTNMHKFDFLTVILYGSLMKMIKNDLLFAHNFIGQLFLC